MVYYGFVIQKALLKNITPTSTEIRPWKFLDPTRKEGNKMARNVSIREIYFYIVCLIAIVIFIIGLVGLSDGIANYIKPNSYMTKASIAPSYQSQNSTLSAEEINKMVEEEIANSLANDRNFALKSILRNSIMIVIAIPLFAFHWRKAQQLWHINLAD